MPFGTFFAALFFTFFGTWLLVGGDGTGWVLSPVARLSLVVLTLALGVALLLGRRWARWTGLLLALTLATLDVLFMTGTLGVAGLLAFLGSVVTALLLAIPATGAVHRDPARAKPAAAGKVCAVLAAVAALAFAVGFLPSLVRGEAQVDRRQGLLAAAERTGRVVWTDFGAGLEQAEQAELPVLVSFVANWCGYCVKMDRTTWRDPEVLRTLREFVPVRVDVDADIERNGFTGQQVASRFGVSGTPTLVLLDRDGKVYSRVGGYQTPSQLIDWLRGALDQLGSSGQANALSATSR